jgi:hypothetical protein
MTVRLASLRIDALDPGGLAAFWAGVLGGEPAAGERGVVTLADPDGRELCVLPEVSRRRRCRSRPGTGSRC